MIRTVTTIFILSVGLLGGATAQADFATVFTEINNKVGDVSEAHGHVVALGHEVDSCHNYLVIVRTDTMQYVILNATADKSVVQGPLLGRPVMIKAKVVDQTQDQQTGRVLPTLRILSVTSSAKKASSASREK